MSKPTFAETLNFKRLGVVFAGAATMLLGGCATMNVTSTDTCVQQRGTQLNLGIINYNNRNDRWSEACATAKAATAIAGMRRADGTPDMAMYNLSVAMYEQSTPGVREFMDKMLKERGTNIEQMKFEIAKADEPVVCAKQETVDGQTSFQCLDRRTQAPALPAAGITQPGAKR